MQRRVGQFPEKMWQRGMFGGSIMGATFTAPAVAAKYSTAQLLIPSASAFITLLIGAWAAKAAAGPIAVANHNTQLTNNYAGIINFAPGQGATTGACYYDALAALDAPNFQLQCGTALAPLWDIDTFILLRPGQAFVLEDTTVNEALTVSFMWVKLG